MYVRITAALAFFGFIIGSIALRLQYKADKRREDAQKRHEAQHSQPKAVLNVLTEQHPYHIVPNSIWPALTAFFVFEVLVFTVKYFHYGLTQYIKHHIIMASSLFICAIGCWF